MEMFKIFYNNVKSGITLTADDGFTCIKNGSQCKVKDSGDGLYVDCVDGKHYLDGQLDDNLQIFIGFSIN